ncbi:MAG: type II toxin-antitoxin system HicB family antitoxin [Bryobacteraceae bacterium]|nr:type II toxin-antitoxin system HicB family antitoxin [Bryobacteraceae bacterium]
MSLKYAVVFEKAANNRAAYVPDLPGCITTASTLSEADLRTVREFGESVPAASIAENWHGYNLVIPE